MRVRGRARVLRWYFILREASGCMSVVLSSLAKEKNLAHCGDEG